MSRGIALGISAYVLWGVLPIFWKSIDSVDSIEILAHRIFFIVRIEGACGQFFFRRAFAKRSVDFHRPAIADQFDRSSQADSNAGQGLGEPSQFSDRATV